jgi:GMP synthase (glutamine-hydrolysing)
MQHIAILDFGSQYTHLIARRIRELEVRADIYSAETKASELPNNAVGIVLSGGPQSVYGKKSPQIDKAIFDLDIPILGLCYGHQLIAKTLGGSVAQGKIHEYGRAQFSAVDTTALFTNAPKTSKVWMSHGDSVTGLPKGFKKIGSTDDCVIAAMQNEDKNFYGLQFHPEVRHTEHGMIILNNFVFDVCKAQKNWNIEDIVDDIIAKTRKQVEDKKVFVLVSGGVDSSVAFALLTKALGEERVYGLYIDTGFMRKHESREIKQNLTQAGFNNLHTHDASKLFYERLKGVVDPEEKRKIIGQTFLDVKDTVAQELKLDADIWMLGQGTIYPDTIETGGTRHADTIKTHHNRVDAIQKLIKHGKVIEPIADFYKDEVRHIGALLKLPHEIIKRHPFPGPGLAIRILCHCEPVDLAGEAILTSSKKKSQVHIQINDKIASLRPDGCTDIKHTVLPVKSVGVQGDNRTYAHALVVWGESDWNKLDAFASNITNSTKEINRVLLMLNSKRHPEAEDTRHKLHGVESKDLVFKTPNEPKTLTKTRTKLLQNIDDIVMQAIKDAGLYDEIWQFPIALIPVGNKHFESVVLRPVVSQEAMTAHFARIDGKLLQTITNKILSTNQIDFVLYDITNKPPGTIEWE